MTDFTSAEYLRHELLDRASTLLNSVDQQLCEHMSLEDESPAFTAEQLVVIRGYTERIARALVGLYQYVGDIHLGGGPFVTSHPLAKSHLVAKVAEELGLPVIDMPLSKDAP